MLADIRRGRIRGLIFSKLARFARNTRELMDFADIFRECDADLISLHEAIDTLEAIDTSTPAGPGTARATRAKPPNAMAKMKKRKGPMNSPDTDRRRRKTRNWRDTAVVWATLLAAIAAMGALVLTRQTMIAAHRAWVLVGDLEVSPHQPRTGHRTFYFNAKNFAGGPAKNVTISTRNFDGVPATFPDLPPATDVDEETIGPNQSITFDVHFPIDFRPDRPPYVLGWIRYTDQFGGSRGTKFCYYAVEVVQAGMRVRQCPRFNDFW